MAEYRWSCAQEWLLDKLESSGEDVVRAFARELAVKVDNDTIQDLFQNEMDSDGFFKPLRRSRS